MSSWLTRLITRTRFDVFRREQALTSELVCNGTKLKINDWPAGVVYPCDVLWINSTIFWRLSCFFTRLDRKSLQIVSCSSRGVCDTVLSNFETRLSDELWRKIDEMSANGHAYSLAHAIVRTDRSVRVTDDIASLWMSCDFRRCFRACRSLRQSEPIIALG